MMLVGKLLFQGNEWGILVLIADYLVREHAKTDGKTSKQ